MLVDELRGLGAQRIIPTDGGVGFCGPFPLCYQVNLESRIASRVLWKVFRGGYENEKDIYQAALTLPWHEWFTVTCTVKVKVSARRCALKSLDFVTLRIKDGVCDSFKNKRGRRPNVETKSPDIQIFSFLDDKHLTLYLDTSGEALFKRGWRYVQGVAPLRENLAAGILRLAGWNSGHVLLDPMCGSGTILIEAAQMARGVAPGIGRPFAFQKLTNYDGRLWSALCTKSLTKQRKIIPAKIYGCDQDSQALSATRTNLESVGLEKSVSLEKADVLTLAPPAAEGILVANPPYGVRLGERNELAKFYPLLGDVLKQKFFGWTAYLFTADPRLPKLVRLSPSRKTPLFNGDLECRLYEFKLVQGGNRKSSRISSRMREREEFTKTFGQEYF